MQGRGDRGGNGRPEVRDRRRIHDEVLAHQDLCRRPGEWRLPGEHLVEHARQRVEVAAAVQVSLAGGLLRAHVGGSTDRHAGGGERLRTRSIHCPRDPEIRDDGVAALEQDVLRLDVAMDHPPGVRVAQCVANFASDLEGGVEGELLLAVEAGAEALPVHKGHHVEEQS